MFKWKWHSQPSGPRDVDLARTIRWGAPGTSMHDFALTDSQLREVVAVVRSFAKGKVLAPDGTLAAGVPPLAHDPAPAPNPKLGAALWTTAGCIACHGAGGAGDGASAKGLQNTAGQPHPPYNLRRFAVRRPRPQNRPQDLRRAIYETVAYGVSGTAMPAMLGNVSDAELWALADYVLTWMPKGKGGDPTRIAAEAIDADQQDFMSAGTWPGAGAPDEARLFGGTIRFQETPTLANGTRSSLPPAVASLSSQQCARCHNKQYTEWQTSLHRAASSPGLLAQIQHIGQPDSMSPADVESCQRCHAPLPEQLPMTRPGHSGTDDHLLTYRANPRFSESLRHEGITCAACHVREQVRHGPPGPAPSLLGLPNYPWKPLAIFERGDFCLPCHQLPPRLAVEGRPLLNTYREWLEGPYMRRGIQCQHCHMPNREHNFRGVHDPDTFRQGLAVAATALRDARGVITIRAYARNAAAGHYLPTTPTPAAWLRSELVDKGGRTIAGTRAELRIGRRIEYRRGRWHDLEDTRIPPGDTANLVSAWQRGRVADAVAAVITVDVHPDDYYEGLYRLRLRGRVAAAARAQYQQALDQALRNRYRAITLNIPIAGPIAGPIAAPAE